MLFWELFCLNDLSKNVCAFFEFLGSFKVSICECYIKTSKIFKDESKKKLLKLL